MHAWENRFWLKVHKTKSGCWEWLGGKNDGGYGQFSVQGKTIGAHRVAYYLFTGVMPKGGHEECVCHSCDNPSCVNPAHLWLGTPKENHADRDAKGHLVRPIGERNGQAKLTTAEVKEIRARWDAWEVTPGGYKLGAAKAIAPDFGVSVSTVGEIGRRVSRAHEA